MGKQLKISELKRVVNVDTFNNYAKLLADITNTDEKEINNVLDELSKKTPSKDVLKQTRLGYILKELSNRDQLPKSVRKKAGRLREKWKDFHKRLLLAPRYDVKCDKPTNESRTRARQSLTSAFQIDSLQFDENKEENKRLILDLEFKIFQCCDTLVNSRYYSLIRKCIKEISDSNDLRDKLIKKERSANEFVLNCSLDCSKNSANELKSPLKQAVFPLFNKKSITK